jgi:hypothetical protein
VAVSNHGTTHSQNHDLLENCSTDVEQGRETLWQEEKLIPHLSNSTRTPAYQTTTKSINF